MPPLPCPHCGETIACSESAVGRNLACPRCRVLLRLDADPSGRPSCGLARRPFGLVRLAVVLGVFVAGLGVGYVLGRVRSHASPSGVNAASVGFFTASNNIVVTDPPAPAPSAKPAAPAPPAGH